MTIFNGSFGLTPITRGGTGAITAEAAAKNLGYGKVLWTGGSYMNASHVMTLDEAVSEQPHGIILVFSRYDGGAANDTFSSHFVPKELVKLMGNNSHTFHMQTGNLADIGTKIIYITNTTVTGYSANINTGTTNGVTYKNNSYVLRYVIGV